MGKSSPSALHHPEFNPSSSKPSDFLPIQKLNPTIQQDNDLYFKDKYKSSKAMLKALEKKNNEIFQELKFAQQQINLLQKQQTSYLNALVIRHGVSEFKDPLASLNLFSKPKKSSNRNFKPYEFLPKKASLNTSKNHKIPTPSQPIPSITKPYTRRDPEAVRKIHPIPVDNLGSFILPAQIGIFKILSLGSIEFERPAFHSKRYILPIGLKISRYYRSTISPDSQALYTSTVLDGGSGPKFEVIADDRPNDPFISDTSSGAWTKILKLASQVRNLQVSNSGSGPEYIGLAHPSIAYMIQSLPNADKCQRYIWQKFNLIIPKSRPKIPQVPDTTQLSPSSTGPSLSITQREISPVSPLNTKDNLEVESDTKKADESLLTKSINTTLQPPKKFRIWE